MDTTFLNLLAEVKESGIWFPTDASASNQVDALAYFILIICGIFLVFNAGLMVFFAVRYRQQKKEGVASGATHNTALEVTWSVIPAFILAIIFIWGFRGFLVQATPPDDSYDIMVTGYKWGWDFTYPDGATSKPMGDEKVAGLHVPANTPIRLTLQSNDVIHSVSIPHMRVKKDCVPGRYNQMWFEANFDEKTAETFELPTAEGESVTVKRNTYDLFCTEYCGQNHSMMIAKVYVYQPEDFEKWYASKSLIPPDTPLVEVGQKVWEGKCKSCHSIDGSGEAQYPSWKDLYGQLGHATSAGPVEVNRAYIYESIRNPGAKIVEGYQNNMPAFSSSQVSDRDIAGIIEFMKTISSEAEAEGGLTYGDLNNDGTVKGEGEAEGEAGDAESEGESDGEAAPQGEADPEAESQEAAQ